MATSLAQAEDVEDMWRPLSAAETPRVLNLIMKASGMLRQRLPSVDTRMAAFAADPTDPTGLDPLTVAVVVATVVKRFLINVSGVVSETVGPYSVTYASRGVNSVGQGEMAVTDLDLKVLAVPVTTTARLGVIRSRPLLAPWPVGVIDSPSGEFGSDWVPDSELPYVAGYDIPDSGLL